jgi:hypothetical protein
MAKTTIDFQTADCGGCIGFVKDRLSFIAEESPMAKVMLSVIGAIAEFERAFIRERQRKGIAIAKQRGARWQTVAAPMPLHAPD